MKKFAVIGNPVNHSLSPVIHQQFARQFGIELEYSKIHADKGQFDQIIKDFRNSGGYGLNVTIPYKSEAYAISDRLSERAKLAQAVNTLSLGGCISGDNTDGIGLVNDIIDNHQFEVADKSILILGAGGAVRGILGPLLAQRPSSIVIANRTAQKAIDLAEHFSTLGEVVGGGLDQIEPLQFELLINGTAASLVDQTPPISAELLSNIKFAYDMMYASKPTVFMRWAQDSGVMNVTDGLGMLVEQAAAAFEIWHDVKPATDRVLTNLRA